jgi:hypothetical protein
MSRRGRALSTSLSSSMPLRAGSSDGGQPHGQCGVCSRCTGTGHSSTQAGARQTCSSLGPRIAISVDQIHRAAGRSQNRALRRQCRATAMTTPGRDDQRPVQGRSHPSTRPMAQLRSRRIRHPRMGRLVQQPPPAGTHRKHPASRSRGKLLRRSGKIRHGRVTKPNQPPANPARFSYPASQLENE